MPIAGPIPEPPEPEVGSVVIGSDVPARVEHLSEMVEVPYRAGLSMSRRWEPSWRVLCDETPCTVNLAYGEHKLQLTALHESGRTSVTTVRVRHRAEVVNHTLGRTRTSIGTIAGGFLLVAGIVALALPYGLDLNSDTRVPDALIGAGIASIFTGAAVMALDPNTRQEGATTHWRPDAAGAAVTAPQGVRGASFKVRF